MKIIDKIVTSITLPQQTNVLWHNPEAGELKMFGNNGWEVVGRGTLPEIVESGWVLDRETLSVAVKVVLEETNTCIYQSRGVCAWVFDDDPGLVTGEIYELNEVNTDNKVSVVCLGNPGGPWTGESKAYAFEGDLDTSKVYSHGTYLAGINNTASGIGSVASGKSTTANGNYSHAEGYNSMTGGSATSNNLIDGSVTTSGAYAHAEGNTTIAKGVSSHSEGQKTFASGQCAHAEGLYTAANGDNSHTEGYNSVANGDTSHAEGYYTSANGLISHVEGNHTIASSAYQHVQGKHNIDDPDGVYQFIIGNGNGGLPSNAFAVKWDGTIVVWKDTNTPLELTPDKLEKLLALAD